KKHKLMISEMAKYSANTDYRKMKPAVRNDFREIKNDSYWLMEGDAIERTKLIDSESVDYSFFSPPFKDLFTYSSDPRDLSNVTDNHSFYNHFRFLVPELFRVLKSGRLLSMHIMQGTTSIGKDGYLSIIDFRGELI